MTTKQIKKTILSVYRKRQKAHDTLLECDVIIDKLLTYLYDNKKVQ